MIINRVYLKKKPNLNNQSSLRKKSKKLKKYKKFNKITKYNNKCKCLKTNKNCILHNKAREKDLRKQK